MSAAVAFSVSREVDGRDVLFHETAFSALRQEGSALFALHWLEASADRSLPLDVDWDAFERLEAVGAEACLAARLGSLLVGYTVYIVHPSLHYRGRLVADCDVFFLRKEDRHGWLGVRLFQVSEQILRARGVQEITYRVKEHVKPGRGRSTLAPVFRWLGFRKIETVWRKRLD